MRFAKYHGIGNDFVMLADLDGRMGRAGTLPATLVVALCDRHTGIGADGVIRIVRDGPMLRMDHYNADGGTAEMCGNGIRCLAVMAHELGEIGPGSHEVVTGAGVRTVVVAPGGSEVAVDMGVPSLEREDVPVAGTGSAVRVGVEMDTGAVEGTGVSMGNPHLVLFTTDLGRELDDDLVLGLGPVLERHPAFPQRTNVEFVDVVSESGIVMRVWERGVGETLACGTGACAAAVASASLGRTKRQVDVRLPGGTLEIRWAEDGHVWMTGPAERVFDGEIDLRWLEERGL